MTSIRDPLEGKYLEAATLYTALKTLSSFNPFFKLPLEKVMLAKGFTEEESKNHSIQQRVRRAAERPPVREAATAEVKAVAQAAARTVTRSNAEELPLVSPSPNQKKCKVVEGSTKQNKIRKTSHQANQHRTNEMIKKQHYACVFMKATIMYAEQKQIPGGMSAKTITDMLNREHNVTISARSVQRYVQQGRTGEVPDSPGPKPAGLCSDTFKLLLSVFESHL